MKQRARLPLAMAAALVLGACAGPAPRGTEWGGVQPAATAAKRATDSYWRRHLLAYHRAHTRLSYRLSGTGEDGTIDCSAYTRNIYRDVFGITLPRKAAQQAQVGRQLNKEDKSSWRPGDLLFFQSQTRGRDQYQDHIGVYVGDGEFIHASVHKGVTKDRLTPYWLQRLKRVSRPLRLPPAVRR